MSPLERGDLEDDPLSTLIGWYEHARSQGVHEPEAMCLATADAAGRPSARMVLMRGLGPEGVDFYTNYESRKARELEENARAALCLYWDSLGRQVRLEGTVSRLANEASAAYFATRERGSQLAAWASRQSQPLRDRATLEREVAEVSRRYPDEVPLPPFWGGFRLAPDEAEFWSEGEFRMHDRFAYRREGGRWTVTRLWP